MPLATWIAVLTAAWFVSLSPGPAAIFAMSNGLGRGFRASVPGTVGLIFGLWTMYAVVAFGLGALLATSVTAFAVLKWIGIAYLVYLGIKQWNAATTPLNAATNARNTVVPDSARTLFIKGWAVNATNPKGYVFLMALLPQFVDAKAPVAMQYLIIALTFAFTEFVVMLGYSAFAARLQALFRTNSQLKLLNRIFGGFYVAAAAFLATFKRVNQ